MVYYLVKKGHSMNKDEHFFYRLTVFDEKTDVKKHFNPKHWHDLLEITVCITGASLVWIDGKEYENHPGGVYVISPRMMHMVQGKEPVCKDTGYCLQIDLKSLYPILPKLRNMSFLPACSQDTSKQLISLIRTIEKSQTSDTEDIWTVLSIVKLLCEKQAGGSNHKAIDDHMMEILNYIKENYRQDLSNDQIAAHFHLSSGHLNRLFRTTLKQSVRSYLMDIRVDRAIWDMQMTNKSLTEICVENGFPNHKSFIAQFRKRFSVSPSEYRKALND